MFMKFQGAEAVRGLGIYFFESGAILRIVPGGKLDYEPIYPAVCEIK